MAYNMWQMINMSNAIHLNSAGTRGNDNGILEMHTCFIYLSHLLRHREVFSLHSSDFGVSSADPHVPPSFLRLGL